MDECYWFGEYMIYDCSCMSFNLEECNAKFHNVWFFLDFLDFRVLSEVRALLCCTTCSKVWIVQDKSLVCRKVCETNIRPVATNLSAGALTKQSDNIWRSSSGRIWKNWETGGKETVAQNQTKKRTSGKFPKSENISKWYCLRSLLFMINEHQYGSIHWKEAGPPQQVLTQTSLKKTLRNLPPMKKKKQNTSTRWFKPWPFCPLVGGHDSPLKGTRFHHPKKVTSRIARYPICFLAAFLRYSTLTEDQLLLLRTGIYTTFFALPGSVNGSIREKNTEREPWRLVV